MQINSIGKQHLEMYISSVLNCFHSGICLPLIFHLLNNFPSSFVKDKSLAFRHKISDATCFTKILPQSLLPKHLSVQKKYLKVCFNLANYSQLYIVIRIFNVVRCIFPDVISLSILLIYAFLSFILISINAVSYGNRF